MTANHEHTPTVLDEMRIAFAMRHWHKTDDYNAGQRIFDDQIAAIEAAAEQRGAVKALREAADIKLGNEYYEMLVEDELNARADIYADQEGGE